MPAEDTDIREGESGLERLSRMGESGELEERAAKLIEEETATRHAEWPTGFDGKTRSDFASDGEDEPESEPARVPLDDANQLWAETLEANPHLDVETLTRVIQDRGLLDETATTDREALRDRLDLAAETALGRQTRGVIDQAQNLQAAIEAYEAAYDSGDPWDDEPDLAAFQTATRELIQSGAGPDVLERLAEEIGDEDAVLDVAQDIAAHRMRLAQAQVEQEVRQEVDNSAIGVAFKRFDQLASLNPDLAADAAEIISSSGLVPATEQEAEVGTLLAFKLARASTMADEQNQAAWDSAVQLHGRGDENYFRFEVLPEMIQNDPGSYSRLAETWSVTAETLVREDFAEATKEWEGTPADMLKAMKAPGYLSRVREHIDAETSKEPLHQQMARASEEAKRYNVRKYGHPSGSHMKGR